jgi:hypothetical protein
MRAIVIFIALFSCTLCTPVVAQTKQVQKKKATDSTKTQQPRPPKKGAGKIGVNVQDVKDTALLVPPPPSDSFSTVLLEDPSFPGGESAWRRYLQVTMTDSVDINDTTITGKHTVVMEFIVKKDGIIGDVWPVSDGHPLLVQECIKIIRKSPKWIPAKKNGTKVEGRKRQPITFVFE